ncbi:hypothetical protein FNF29_04512 [Cafeteria roenbergensis]|uniref:Uncharacterized protein n=1 Tax=Cafeteria roenbergensis TaxID=33653 RepID=A0A5A8CFR5_CAFRO|nr:hypothetical protein FNF29_04512 [Cafeteria roenbergensis]|eukprot:KAA0151588.1 hypothetical protein FNF29_04512 [Cafeteria roenbergensis]
MSATERRLALRLYRELLRHAEAYEARPELKAVVRASMTQSPAARPGALPSLASGPVALGSSAGPATAQRASRAASAFSHAGSAGMPPAEHPGPARFILPGGRRTYVPGVDFVLAVRQAFRRPLRAGETADQRIDEALAALRISGRTISIARAEGLLRPGETFPADCPAAAAELRRSRAEPVPEDVDLSASGAGRGPLPSGRVAAAEAPIPGTFLVAHPAMADARFCRTVVMVLDWNPKAGAVGVVVNPTALLTRLPPLASLGLPANAAARQLTAAALGRLGGPSGRTRRPGRRRPMAPEAVEDIVASNGWPERQPAAHDRGTAAATAAATTAAADAAEQAAAAPVSSATTANASKPSACSAEQPEDEALGGARGEAAPGSDGSPAVAMMGARPASDGAVIEEHFHLPAGAKLRESLAWWMLQRTRHSLPDDLRAAAASAAPAASPAAFAAPSSVAPGAAAAERPRWAVPVASGDIETLPALFVPGLRTATDAPVRVADAQTYLRRRAEQARETGERLLERRAALDRVAAAEADSAEAALDPAGATAEREGTRPGVIAALGQWIRRLAGSSARDTAVPTAPAATGATAPSQAASAASAAPGPADTLAAIEEAERRAAIDQLLVGVNVLPGGPVSGFTLLHRFGPAAVHSISGLPAASLGDAPSAPAHGATGRSTTGEDGSLSRRVAVMKAIRSDSLRKAVQDEATRRVVTPITRPSTLLQQPKGGKGSAGASGQAAGDSAAHTKPRLHRTQGRRRGRAIHAPARTVGSAAPPVAPAAARDAASVSWPSQSIFVDGSPAELGEGAMAALRNAIVQGQSLPSHQPVGQASARAAADLRDDDAVAFEGLASWSAGQLEAELAEGSWFNVHVDDVWSLVRQGAGLHVDHPFVPTAWPSRDGSSADADAKADSAPTGADLWTAVLSSLGGEYAALAHAHVAAGSAELGEEDADHTAKRKSALGSLAGAEEAGEAEAGQAGPASFDFGVVWSDEEDEAADIMTEAAEFDDGDVSRTIERRRRAAESLMSDAVDSAKAGGMGGLAAMLGTGDDDDDDDDDDHDDYDGRSVGVSRGRATVVPVLLPRPGGVVRRPGRSHDDSDDDSDDDDSDEDDSDDDPGAELDARMQAMSQLLAQAAASPGRARSGVGILPEDAQAINQLLEEARAEGLQASDRDSESDSSDEYVDESATELEARLQPHQHDDDDDDLFSGPEDNGAEGDGSDEADGAHHQPGDRISIQRAVASAVGAEKDSGWQSLSEEDTLSARASVDYDGAEFRLPPPGYASVGGFGAGFGREARQLAGRVSVLKASALPRELPSSWYESDIDRHGRRILPELAGSVSSPATDIFLSAGRRAQGGQADNALLGALPTAGRRRPRLGGSGQIPAEGRSGDRLVLEAARSLGVPAQQAIRFVESMDPATLDALGQSLVSAQQGDEEGFDSLQRQARRAAAAAAARASGGEPGGIAASGATTARGSRPPLVGGRTFVMSEDGIRPVAPAAPASDASRPGASEGAGSDAEAASAASEEQDTQAGNGGATGPSDAAACETGSDDSDDWDNPRR